MLRAIALFEIRYQLRQPLFYVLFLMLGAMTFLGISTDAVSIGGSLGNINRNAPFVILQFMAVMSILGLFVNTALVAPAVLRDFEQRTDELFFSKPLKKNDYLLGRFFGAAAVACLVYLGPLLGVFLGSLMPWLDPTRLGPFQIEPYLFALGIFVLPDVLLSGAIFFAIAAWSRSMLATYLGTIGLLAAYLVGSRLMADLEDQNVAVLLDPFGLSSLRLAARYFTVAEMNSQVPPLTSYLITNRLIWVGLALALLALAIWRFRFEKASTRRSFFGCKAAAPGPAAEVARASAPYRPIAPSFEKSAWRQYLRATRLETSALLKGLLFLVMLAFSAFNIYGGTRDAGRLFGTDIYPMTYMMVEVIRDSSFFLLGIILTFYAGELIWRERQTGLADVVDALPTPNGVFLAAKGTALLLMSVLFLAGGMLTTLLVQAGSGYFDFELPVYFRGLALEGLPFLMILVLALFVQVMVNQKFIAYLGMILFLISSQVLAAWGFDHNLYQFATFPLMPYSAMNGYGHYLQGALTFALYWACACLVMMGLASLFWVRGRDSAWRFRKALAARRFHGLPKGLVLAGGAAFVAVGAFIFYNTNILNTYHTPETLRDQLVEYEQKYRQYRDLEQPRIIAAKVDVDLEPRKQSMAARGVFTLKNTSEQPQSALHYNLAPEVERVKLELPPHRVVSDDRELGYTIVELDPPIAPGATFEMKFEVRQERKGFVNDGAQTAIVDNGTFMNNVGFFPVLGYVEARELGDPHERRKRDLPEVHRWPKIDDEAARRFNYVSRDADWVTFESTVSTDLDQIAIAPGYLQKEWEANGRRYFHYKMDAPILNFYSYLSADYQVKRDRWNDVAIEIFYDERHAFNVDRMIDGVKKSLDYFTREFGPYQHRQVRILEFPRYAMFAQAFPNTIPFSEGIGFIAKIDDEDDIDYVFYVTAHEVAHQWWAHQVIGAEMQGATMLSESLAQYSALMVMEKEYGRDQMRRFLKYELDNYLRSRSREAIEEMPLRLVENQPYVHYRKGSVIFYALRDALGEETLNRAIRRFRDAHAFQPPPYPTTTQFLDFLRQETPAELQTLLADSFDRITLFDNRAQEATYRANADGTYQVTLKAQAKKLYADGQGLEQDAELDDWVEIGVFGEQDQGEKTLGKVLFLEKRRLQGGPEQTIELTVAEKPRKAGIDPYVKLIDRSSNDNVKTVAEAPSP